MKVQHLAPATALALLLGGIWAVPAGLSAITGHSSVPSVQPTDTTTIKLSSQHGDVATFDLPRRSSPGTYADQWKAQPQSTTGLAQLVATGLHTPAGFETTATAHPTPTPTENQNFHVVASVIGGADATSTTFNRRLQSLSRDGIEATFDGATINTPSGLKGRTCVALTTPGQTKSEPNGTVGRCAILEKGGVMVTFVVLAPSVDTAQPAIATNLGQQTALLNALLATVEVKPA